jgi:hypothetical protein
VEARSLGRRWVGLRSGFGQGEGQPLPLRHPRLQRWIRGKQHLLELNRRDMITSPARKQWDRWFRDHGHTPWWCDAKVGTGVKQLQEATLPDAKGWLAAATRHISGDPLRMAQRLLDDFRRSLLGPIALELPGSITGLRA